eukprot:TRINITY_DN551_c0_g1_i1.p1 TRINITY_DN551_c0_g1~~TRINITY_DN551_c0_g1_i1.p1  ORF type:complete len:646 (+),score=135.50 TRINITY_DN551_c0_g1_i1:41-1978(+)
MKQHQSAPIMIAAPDSTEQHDGFFLGDTVDDEFSSILSSSFGSTTSVVAPDSTLVDDLSVSLFTGLFVTDKQEQKQAAEAITNLLKEALKSQNCRQIRTHLPTIVRFATECPFPIIRDHFSKFLQNTKPEFDAKGIVIPVSVTHPSKFFSSADTLPIDSKDPEVSEIFQTSFLEWGRVSHLTRLMAWHPEYYRTFVKSHSVLMRSPDGPLPLPLRNYIGIMAAATYKCSYLVQEQEKEFLQNLSNLGDDYYYNGNNNNSNPLSESSWVKYGISAASAQMKNLIHVNLILAHRPWDLKKEHLEALLKGNGSGGCGLWSMAELVHAIILMASFRSLAGFVWAMGITPEVDFDFKDDFDNSSTMSATSTGSNSGSASTSTSASLSNSPEATSHSETMQLIHKLNSESFGIQMPSACVKGRIERNINNNNNNNNNTGHNNNLDDNNDDNDDDVDDDDGDDENEDDVHLNDHQKPERKRTSKSTPTSSDGRETVNNANNNNNSHSIFTKSHDLDKNENNNNSSYWSEELDSKYGDDAFIASSTYSQNRNKLIIEHDDYDCEEDKILHILDFPWGTYGYSIVRRFFSEMADRLDSCFATILKLTYKSVGNQQAVNTEPFRLAIWYYVHRVEGIIYDDFDYQKVGFMFRYDT